ncbi:concanavalin A-like lectin/glucanase domain-containing protein [Phyllosticta capitalensis]
MAPVVFLDRLNVLGVLCAALLGNVLATSCDCGYSLNQTNATSYALFTDLMETDFLHVTDLKAAGWTPQVYNVTPTAARGPYGKMALLENVVPNAVKNEWDWAGESVNGGDAGLQVYVRADPVDDMIPMGELVIQRTDMLLGSFRVAMKISSAAGTCGAFFWFRNDTQEIDMEFLSKQLNDTSNPVNLVLQSPQSAEAGYDASHTQTYDIYPLPFRPDDGFHEYRFDWLEDRVSFYADGQWLKDMTIDLPNSAGHLVVNHWSNGDPGWSSGPPATDAVLTVSYVKAYFNSSDAQRQRDYRRRCGKWDPQTQCVIPDQTRAPGGSNATARTFFFSADPDEVGNQTVFADWPNESRRSVDGGAEWGMLVFGVVVAAGAGWLGLV